MTSSGDPRDAWGRRDSSALRSGVIPLGEVVAAHARVCSSQQLVDDRRALYRVALDLVGLDGTGRVPDDVVDDPALRFAVGEVLAGRRPPGELRLPGRPLAVPPPSIVGDAARCADLRPALDAVAGETGAAPGLIVEGDPRFRDAVVQVRIGLDAAAALVPDLFADLVGHVAVIGMLDPARSGTVVSASSRVMPGAVLLRPGTPLEVAESFVHEAAHQRLFDMALSRDMLRADADGVDGFRPSWRPVTWPREQALAAFHTYACLAQLWRAVPADPRPELTAHSVLPAAASRAREIGEWLFERLDRLGSDACVLVGALLDRPLPLAPAPRVEPCPGRYRAGRSTIVVPRGDRYLVGVPGAIPQLFWLDRETATVLRILDDHEALPVEEIRARFPTQHGLLLPEAAVWGALDRLVQAELAAVVDV